MSSGTAIAHTTNGHAPPEATDGFVSAQTMEAVVVGGDLSKLSPKQRLEWYAGRCEAAGLDPRTQPFQYLSLSGKLTLYATKTATDQLIARRRLTVAILERQALSDMGIYEVRCRVTAPDGQSVEDVAALSIAGLKGEALCNAVMKCVTKAKRRTVLSACGLGMLDESEVETIGGARVVEVAADGEILGSLPPPSSMPALPPPNNDSGHGRGEYASPAQEAKYREFLKGFLDRVNAEWADRWTDRETMEPIDGIPEMLNPWQCNSHLVKWGVNTGRLDPAILPEDLQARKRDNYPAVMFVKWPKSIRDELEAYAKQQAQEKAQAVYRKFPHLDPDREVKAEDASQDEDSEPWSDDGQAIDG